MFPAFSFYCRPVTNLTVTAQKLRYFSSKFMIFSSSDEGNEELLSENLEEALELSDDSDCST